MDSRRALPTELMERFSDFLAEQMGLRFPPERWPDLESALGEAAPALGCNDAEACVRWLLSSSLTRSQIETLASRLTVGETYFFRESRVFEALEHHILPELIHKRRDEKRLRIWSAACASGEEPYSIAILLDRLLPDLADWDVTLLATDINPQALKKAAEGVYREWSFRRTPPEIKQCCFKKIGEGRYELDPRIRKLVAFNYLNLAEDSYPSLLGNTNAMDVIFCRNALIYFEPERARRVIEKLHRCLLDGGWLAVGQTEASHVNFERFETVNLSDAILYRKPDQQLHAVADVAAPSDDQSQPPLPRPERPIASTDPAAMARALANQGRLEEAHACCERAIAAEKLNAGRYYLLAMIAQERGALDEAAQALRRAVFLDPDFALAHFALGSVAERRGRRAEASRQYANAVALLESRRPEELLPEGEGMTVGSLMEMIRARAIAGGED